MAMEKAQAREQETRRPLVFLLYLAGGLLIFLFGSNYHANFPTNKNALFEWGTTLAFLALAFLLYRAERFRRYWPAAFALFVASFANAALLAFGHVLDPILPIPATGAQSLAMDKLEQALPIILSIVLLTKLAGGDLGSIFLKRGRLRQGLTFGLTSFGVFAVIFAVIVFAQADAPVTTGLTASGVSLATVVAALPWILIFIFANSIMEELWFRGIALRKLTPILGTAATVAVTALVFGSVHIGASYVNSSEAVFFAAITSVFGLINGYVMLKTDSIWGSVLFHAGYDLLVILPLLVTM
jgi:membrane protease YdiL (CAAX protease family)